MLNAGSQGMFKESVAALQEGLTIDPNNAAQLKEKTDTELCVRKMERARELMSQVCWRAQVLVWRLAYAACAAWVL